MVWSVDAPTSLTDRAENRSDARPTACWLRLRARQATRRARRRRGQLRRRAHAHRGGLATRDPLAAAVRRLWRAAHVLFAHRLGVRHARTTRRKGDAASLAGALGTANAAARGTG